MNALRTGDRTVGAAWFPLRVRVDAPVAPPAQHWLGQSLRRLFANPRLVVALFAVPAGVLLAGLVSWLIDWRLGVDSAVYRSGAIALNSDRSVTKQGTKIQLAMGTGSSQERM